MIPHTKTVTITADPKPIDLKVELAALGTWLHELGQVALGLPDVECARRISEAEYNIKQAGIGLAAEGRM